VVVEEYRRKSRADGGLHQHKLVAETRHNGELAAGPEVAKAGHRAYKEHRMRTKELGWVGFDVS
jgi:hypothetical protein